MEELATSVLSYALWPLLTLAIVALWVAAILDISRHRRRGTSTNAGLLYMTTLVSVVAVIAVAGISAVLAAQWTEAVSGASSGEIQGNKLEGSTRAYIFSFGLENASYGPPADSTGAKKSHNRVAR
jgi:hypothetical protein